jgi:hypothetical protein
LFESVFVSVVRVFGVPVVVVVVEVAVACVAE